MQFKYNRTAPTSEAMLDSKFLKLQNKIVCAWNKARIEEHIGKYQAQCGKIKVKLEKIKQREEMTNQQQRGRRQTQPQQVDKDIDLKTQPLPLPILTHPSINKSPSSITKPSCPTAPLPMLSPSNVVFLTSLVRQHYKVGTAPHQVEEVDKEMQEEQDKELKAFSKTLEEPSQPPLPSYQTPSIPSYKVNKNKE